VGNPDILIDILVGRRLDDLRALNSTLERHFGRSIASVVSAFRDGYLRQAMEIVVEMSRPDNNQPVDSALIHQDLVELLTFLDSSVHPADFTTLMLNIFLRRNDIHLIELADQFQVSTGKNLDSLIQREYTLHSVGKKACSHALRSAVDLTYRDTISLQESFDGGSYENLAIRITRLHWYKHHMKQVRSNFLGFHQGDLVEKLRKREGLVWELLAFMFET
jgi:hypothetical protein